jgi:hypothetical protein
MNCSTHSALNGKQARLPPLRHLCAGARPAGALPSSSRHRPRRLIAPEGNLADNVARAIRAISRLIHRGDGG